MKKTSSRKIVFTFVREVPGRIRALLSRPALQAVCLLCLALCLASCGASGQARPAAQTGVSAAAAGEGAESGPAEPSAESSPGPGRTGSPAETDSLEDPDQVSGTADLQQAVRTRVEDLSGKYALTILCGKEVPQTYRDYTAVPLSDPEKILDALDTLDRTLSLYPPGFFSSVREGFCDSINICIARDLRAIDGGSYLESAHAFTTVQDNAIWLVLNAGEEVRASTLIHEITHVTDYRLLGMHQLRESEWNRLNPSGFTYYNAYLDEAGNDLRVTGSPENTSLFEEEPDQIWFYDPYSKTFAMEDRARLMEKLLENAAGGSPDLLPDRCFESPHVQTKLRFYFYTLRRELGTGRWPDQTSWEAILSCLPDSRKD